MPALTPLSFARLHERGTALVRWLDAGGDADRLVALDRQARHAERTDWPGRASGPEPRTREAERRRRRAEP